MKKEWGFVEKILDGSKTIESRWYLSKRAPWNMMKKKDKVYFKNSGDLVSIEAEVKKVVQVSELTPTKVKTILEKHGKDIGIAKKDAAEFFKKFRGKKYCILIFLKNPQRIAPFQINKKGFGAMAAWITVKNIHEVQQISQR